MGNGVSSHFWAYAVGPIILVGLPLLACGFSNRGRELLESLLCCDADVVAEKEEVRRNKVHDEVRNKDVIIDVRDEVRNKDVSNKDARSKDASNKDARNKDARNKDARNKDASNKDASNKDASNKDASNKDARNKDASNKDASNKDASNKDARNKDARNKDASNKDASNKDASNKDARNKDASNKDASNKDASNKDARNKDASNKDARNKDASNKDASNKDASNKDARNKDASNKDARNKNARNKDVSNKDASNKDVHNKDASNKDARNKNVRNKDVSNKDVRIDVCDEVRDYAPIRFDYDVLSRATDNFSAGARIGGGHFGDVYKAELQIPTRGVMEVAVKKLNSIQNQSKKEFDREVENSALLKHRNMVEFIGHCRHRSKTGAVKKQLVVFKFVPNRTLHYHLHDSPIPLSWPNRHKIALGMASGVSYLHGGLNQCFIHRDIKPQNVMLEVDFTPKLGDFGLARLTDHDHSMETTAIGCTLGYVAPEVFNSGVKPSKESDVYSFGIVVLEIATGRQPTDEKWQDEMPLGLRMWVWELNKANCVLKAVDEKLVGDQYKLYNEDEAKRMLVVGLLCCHYSASERPTIEEAKSLLNANTPLPDKYVRYLEGNYYDAPGQKAWSIYNDLGISLGTSLDQPSNNNKSSSQYHAPDQSDKEASTEISRPSPPAPNPRKVAPEFMGSST